MCVCVCVCVNRSLESPLSSQTSTEETELSSELGKPRLALNSPGILFLLGNGGEVEKVLSEETELTTARISYVLEKGFRQGSISVSGSLKLLPNCI